FTGLGAGVKLTDIVGLEDYFSGDGGSRVEAKPMSLAQIKFLLELLINDPRLAYDVRMEYPRYDSSLNIFSSSKLGFWLPDVFKKLDSMMEEKGNVVVKFKDIQGIKGYGGDILQAVMILNGLMSARSAIKLIGQTNYNEFLRLRSAPLESKDGGYGLSAPKLAAWSVGSAIAGFGFSYWLSHSIPNALVFAAFIGILQAALYSEPVMKRLMMQDDNYLGPEALHPRRDGGDDANVAEKLDAFIRSIQRKNMWISQYYPKIARAKDHAYYYPRILHAFVKFDVIGIDLDPVQDSDIVNAIETIYAKPYTLGQQIRNHFLVFMGLPLWELETKMRGATILKKHYEGHGQPGQAQEFLDRSFPKFVVMVNEYSDISQWDAFWLGSIRYGEHMRECAMKLVELYGAEYVERRLVMFTQKAEDFLSDAIEVVKAQEMRKDAGLLSKDGGSEEIKPLSKEYFSTPEFLNRQMKQAQTKQSLGRLFKVFTGLSAVAIGAIVISIVVIPLTQLFYIVPLSIGVYLAFFAAVMTYEASRTVSEPDILPQELVRWIQEQVQDPFVPSYISAATLSMYVAHHPKLVLRAEDMGFNIFDRVLYAYPGQGAERQISPATYKAVMQSVENYFAAMQDVVKTGWYRQYGLKADEMMKTYLEDQEDFYFYRKAYARMPAIHLLQREYIHTLSHDEKAESLSLQLQGRDIEPFLKKIFDRKVRDIFDRYEQRQKETDGGKQKDGVDTGFEGAAIAIGRPVFLMVMRSAVFTAAAGAISSIILPYNPGLWTMIVFGAAAASFVGQAVYAAASLSAHAYLAMRSIADGIKAILADYHLVIVPQEAAVESSDHAPEPASSDNDAMDGGTGDEKSFYEKLKSAILPGQEAETVEPKWYAETAFPLTDGFIKKVVSAKQRIALVADDDFNMLRNNALKYLMQGYFVVRAKDGTEAWEIYQKVRSAGRLFDVVNTDRYMPQMRGDELAGLIDNQVPVIMVTGDPDISAAKYKLAAVLDKHGLFDSVLSQTLEPLGLSGKADKEVVLEELIGLSHNSEEPRERMFAIDMLAAFDEEAGNNALRELSGNDDVLVRRAAVSAIKNIWDDAMVELCIRAARDPDLHVRYFALYHLLFLSRNATDAQKIEIIRLAQGLLSDPNEFISELAAQVLEKYGSDKTVELRMKQLKHVDPKIRRQAAEAMGDLKDARAVPALIEALKDEDDLVRGEAALALGYIGDRAALIPLKDALQREKGRQFSFADVDIKFALQILERDGDEAKDGGSTVQSEYAMTDAQYVAQILKGM
ncbi:MAG: HEAT repeat domain-containing protein, partial [Candidatus Omnitrophota bacterium]